MPRRARDRLLFVLGVLAVGSLLQGCSQPKAPVAQPELPNEHPRDVAIYSPESGVVTGRVTVQDGSAECADSVFVRLVYERAGKTPWRTKTILTDKHGAFAFKVSTSHPWQAVADAEPLDSGSACARALSSPLGT